MTGPCPREAEVVSAVIEDRWPDGCGYDLEAHVADCHDCRDAVEICGMLREAHTSDTQTQAPDARTVPAAAGVWLRAAVRLRAEAEHRANRSLTWALGIGGACAVGLGLSTLGALRPTFNWLTARAAILIARLASPAEEATDVIVRTLEGNIPVAFPIVAGLVFTPLVVCLTFSVLSRLFFRSPPRHNASPPAGI